jgi:beta-glucosidase
MIDLNKSFFGDDFKWGVSTAAFQIEGACDADGKGESIWDAFTAKKGKIRNSDTADIACDFYNNYKADIDLVKQLNIPNFRFSISWPRILPTGTDNINQAGIDYYNQVIDYCIAQGIEPWVTIYHWDLPQALEVKGGWTNRNIIEWFTSYTAICAQHFGDRVKHWMIMNEPSVFSGAGYFFGMRGQKNCANYCLMLKLVLLFPVLILNPDQIVKEISKQRILRMLW